MIVNEAINGEIRRLVNLLPSVDPISQTDTYDKIVDNLTSLIYLSYHGEDTGEEKPPTEEPYIEPIPFPEPSTEEYTAPVMEAAVTTTEIAGSVLTADKLRDPAPAYTKEEVRAALARSRKNGLNVSELLAEFGAENFTGLPAAKYPEVMARIGAV